MKDKKVNTTQTEDELKVLFSPGKEFVFNAILELESASEDAPEVAPEVES